ncbi:hypothetical protein [Paenibacillus sp. OAS669]|uniref:hypothetical protein n=1 Tax=Paenibacillus sp. OAS669 TaxID=2663821 RepID=UPI0017894E68|nr:hypothetical protein [Paenibacillus sp. OAS669]MBE1445168.1 hypothetical protein [Paenibacillus sp. OAS669]
MGKGDHERKKIITILALGLGVVACYHSMDALILIDDTENSYGIYDFFKLSTDAELKVQGTGRQFVDGELVSTKVKVLEIMNKEEDLNISVGDEMVVHEYFKIIKNSQIYGIPLPGRRVTNMGTGYRRLQQGEVGMIRIHHDRGQKRLWVIGSRS